jgi:hypothetical protein
MATPPTLRITAFTRPSLSANPDQPAGRCLAARIQAHDIFDRLWMPPGAPLTRGEAYRAIAARMGIAGQLHIGEQDEAGCAAVVAAAIAEMDDQARARAGRA